MSNLRSDAGSATVEFLAATLGALTVTASTLLVFLAALARIVATDAVESVTIEAMHADQADSNTWPTEASIFSEIQARLDQFPIRLRLKSASISRLEVGGLGAGIAALVDAALYLPGLEATPLVQEVRIRVGSELN